MTGIRHNTNAQRLSAGFSLMELLVTLLILTLATTVIATGMPLAISAYNKVVDGSNAQVLLSTTTTLLRDELGNASGEIDVAGNEITYSRATGVVAKLHVDTDESNSNPTIFITESRATGETYNKPLVSSDTATNGLTITYESVSEPTDGVLTFNNVRVNKLDDEGNQIYGGPLAELDKLKVRVLSQ